MKCRHCQSELKFEFIDLFNSPPSNSYLNAKELGEPEVFYPLKIFVCEHCYLVQIDEYKKSNDIFNNEYAYFSSFSKSWLEHSKTYVDMITERLNLGSSSHVIEVASNDGYLLQYFIEKGIPCTGIEPTSNTAKVAKEKGITVIEEFFNSSLAKRINKADLIIGNNVLAHVPNINDFVAGLKIALNPSGTITMEFPHLLKLIEGNQFDTIYHEHFSYLSLSAVSQIFETQGLVVYDVEEIPTHGGSLRIFAGHKNENPEIYSNVQKVIDDEKNANLNTIQGYLTLQENAKRIKIDFIQFLIKACNEGKKVAAYGAAAKGNTLLNYCGVKNDLIEFVVDRAPSKQGKYLPGSHIPVVSEEYLTKEKPDYIVIFPWNIKEEIIEQLEYAKEWNCEFVVAIPGLQIIR